MDASATPSCTSRPDSARGQGRHRRGLRAAAGDQHDRPALRGPARTRLRRGLRHQLRSRRDHHGGGLRVRRAPWRLARQAAPHNHLLPLMGRLHGEVPSGADSALLQLQEPARHRGRPGEDLLRQEEGAQAGGRLRGVDHALHLEEVESRGARRCSPAASRTSTCP
jgi:hypothetical protein